MTFTMDAPLWGGVAFPRGYLVPRKAVVILPSLSSYETRSIARPRSHCTNQFIFSLAEQRASASITSYSYLQCNLLTLSRIFEIQRREADLTCVSCLSFG